jgi:hypothetical protein
MTIQATAGTPLTEVEAEPGRTHEGEMTPDFPPQVTLKSQR